MKALLPEITGLPTYSDLSFKLNFPTKNTGVFSFWGINGIADIANKLDKDPTKWKTNLESSQYKIGYDLAALGINNKAILSPTTFLFTSVSFTTTKYNHNSVFYRLNLQEVPLTKQNEIESKLSFSAYLNHKFNSRHTNKSGIILNRLSFNYDVANNTNIAENNIADFFVDSKAQRLVISFTPSQNSICVKIYMLMLGHIYSSST